MIKMFFNMIIILFVFLLGVLAGGIYNNWGILKLTFLNIRLFEILQLISLFTIGYFINFSLNREATKSNKQKELIIDLYDDIDSKISELYSDGVAYMDNKKDGSPIKILQKIDYISNLLNTFKGINLTTKNISQNESNSFLEYFFQFKKILTDDPLRIINENYMESSKEDFTNYFNTFKSNIFNFKQKLYQ